LDQSVYVEDTSYDFEDQTVESNRSSILSPSGSPRLNVDDAEGEKARSLRGKKPKIILTNDLGQVRLTAKMREKENNLRRDLSILKNRTLRQSEKYRMINDFL